MPCSRICRRIVKNRKLHSILIESKLMKTVLSLLTLAALSTSAFAGDACKKCCESKGKTCASCCKDTGKACGKDCCVKEEK